MDAWNSPPARARPQAQPWFVPTGAINALRRDAVAAPRAVYPDTQLTYLANVYNEKARAFYRKLGVEMIDAAYEAHEETGEVSLMITKHCLRFSFNLCPNQAKGVQGVHGQVKAEPMTLVSGDERYTLRFDCKPCETHVVGAMKPSILKSPPPSAVPYSPLVPLPASVILKKHSRLCQFSPLNCGLEMKYAGHPHERKLYNIYIIEDSR